jgi:serine/threonine-protein kinase HipA
MPISSDRAYVYLQPPGSLEVATAGFFEQQQRAGVAVAIFIYSPAYLERSDAVALDPFELPLRAGRFETVKVSGIFGALRDASPDAWGRHIIERQLHRTDLSEVEYLLSSPEDRVGALSFGRGKSPPPPESRFNKILELAKLLEVTQAIELNDTAELPPQVEELVQPGTSLGGARPKNVVETDDGLWIAKFPAREDRWNNARVEASMLALARECNVSACDHRVAGIGGTDVLLVRRFDRVRIEGGIYAIASSAG